QPFQPIPRVALVSPGRRLPVFRPGNADSGAGVPVAAAAVFGGGRNFGKRQILLCPGRAFGGAIGRDEERDRVGLGKSDETAWGSSDRQPGSSAVADGALRREPGGDGPATAGDAGAEWDGAGGGGPAVQTRARLQSAGGGGPVRGVVPLPAERSGARGDGR